MLRFLRSLILGLLLGSLAGMYLGWILFPSNARRSHLSELAQPYRDDYTVMIAAGYALDQDLASAIERLQKLDLADPPTYLRQTTERVIVSSSRAIADIRLLVALAHDLGQLTPVMRPFLDLGGDNA